MRFIVLCFLLQAFPLSAFSTEEPSFEVVQSDGQYEIRQYQPMIVAEVEVDGDMRDAGSKAFKTLANFIFGGNKRQDKLEMTAPVTREKSVKIEMTAPVTRTQSDQDRWVVAFVMPSKWTMETLPVPDDASISIRPEPARLVATVKFPGWASEADFEKKLIALESWLGEKNYVVEGQPKFAGYNPPWTLGPMRRNEVIVPVSTATDN